MGSRGNKNFLQLSILFGIIFVINSNKAHAGSDIEIKVDKSVSANLTDYKYWVSVDSGLETWMKSEKKWKWIGFAQ